jgi:CDP-glycerol glycerophosphotransferase (TagB/SpsB family)
VRWFCENEIDKLLYNDDEVVIKNIEDVMTYNPDIVLVSTNMVAHFIPGIKVQIFHGFSVNKRSQQKGHFNIRGFFDLYCTQGPSTTKPFLELQQKHKHFEVIETGWSKMDPLFFGKEDTIKKSKPTILISSTFTPRLSLAHNEKVKEQIFKLSKQGHYHFIAVLHPMMQKSIVDEFKNMQHEYFTFYDTTDLIPLYRQADLMISDTTSAIVEFVLQRKNVITINNNKPQPYMINITDESKLQEMIEYGLKTDELNGKIDEFVTQTHPYSDGKSSQRIVDACIDFLKHNQIKRKPLNLVRKFKIRKKLNYFKVF